MCPDPNSVLSPAPGKADPCHIWVRGSNDPKTGSTELSVYLSCPPISSPNEWGCSNRLGRASLLPRIPAFALEHGLTWIGAEPSSVRSGRFSPTGGVTPVTARGVDEHFCHVAQVRATRVPEHSGCCCFSSRHRAARCSRHVERSGGLVRMTGVFKHKVRRVRVVCMEQWGIPSSRDRRWG